MKVILELMRYKNCTMAGLAGVIGAVIAYGLSPGELLWMPLVFISIFLITGAGNAINDYFDAGIDAVNRPARPIPSGRITKDFVFKIAIALFASGIVVASVIGSPQIPFFSRIPLFIAIFNSLLLYFYAFSLKRKVFIGNLSVSYLSGSTFLYGGAAYGEKGIKVAIVLFFLSMLATLAREIVKAIEDIEGDRKDGAVTLPVKIGERPCAFIASFFGIIAVLLSPIPFKMGLFNEYYLFAVAIADIVFLYAVYLILRGDPTASSKYFKVGMFLAMLAFIAGSIFNTNVLG